MMAKKKWPPLENFRSKKVWPKVTIAEAKAMGIEPVELLADRGYVMLGTDGKPLPVGDFEYNGD
jgi:hypothetical protein